MTEEKADEYIKQYGDSLPMWKVKSFSREDEFHIVYNRKGFWSCSCEFKMHHPTKVCDHERLVRHKRMKYHGRKVEAKIKKEKEQKMVKKLERTRYILDRRLRYITCRISEVPKGQYYYLRYMQETKILIRDLKSIDKDIQKLKRPAIKYSRSWLERRCPSETKNIISENA